RLCGSWKRRRVVAVVVLAAIGFLAGGTPAGSHASGWALAGLLTALALVILYAGLLRFDLTLVPLALAVMTAIGGVMRGMNGGSPGALTGSIVAAVALVLVGLWWFYALRPTRPRTSGLGPPSPAV